MIISEFYSNGSDAGDVDVFLHDFDTLFLTYLSDTKMWFSLYLFNSVFNTQNPNTPQTTEV